MALHEEACRFDIELLADVFADLDQRLTALAAGAGLGFVSLLDARQMIGQRLPACGLALGAHGGRDLFDFGLDCAQVDVPSFLEQIALLGREGFVLMPEADAAMVREFQGEGLDLELRGLEFKIARCEGLAGLILQLRERLGHPIGQVWSGLETGQFSLEIHA